MIKVNCYTCKKVTVFEDEGLFPFCSQECKDPWASKAYGKMKDGKRVYTIEEMQERIKQMAQEVAEHKK